jgi:glyoxylase-like metal-dependent hydrolase (beta-lactamase superfamily II)
MPAGSYPFAVGELRCSVLSDGYTAHPAPWLFPNADPEQLRAGLYANGLPTLSVVTPLTCLLIETGREVILIDAGAGPGSPTTGALVARLEVAGIRPQDVGTVVLTHAHPDHIGGAVDAAWHPTFPNARHLIAEAEVDFWCGTQPDLSRLRLPRSITAGMSETAEAVLTAIRHHVETIWGEHEIVPGVRALPAPGHTPGHLAIELSSGGQTLLHMGDAAEHPLHLERLDWDCGYDQDPVLALATRRALLERANAAAAPVLAFHFPFPSLGRLSAGPDGGSRWSPGW